MKKPLKGEVRPPYADNSLLAALTPQLFDRLAFEIVEMKLGAVLCRAGSRVEAAHFPLSGMISLVHTLEDGDTVEVGLVGREGFLGVPLLFGTDLSPVEALVQGRGTALRLPRESFISEIAGNAPMRAKLLKFAGALYSQTIQTAACNARHKVPERLARWMLETHDRMRIDEIPVRHAFIAYMLGCRRAGISEAIGSLRRQGVIALGRGTIIIADRRALEAAACGCYEVVRSEYERVLA